MSISAHWKRGETLLKIPKALSSIIAKEERLWLG